MSVATKERPITKEKINFLEDIKMAPPDPLLDLSVAFRADQNPKKVNLGVGSIRDESGKPHVFPVVRQAENYIINDVSLDKYYSPIDGEEEFLEGARQVLLGWGDEDAVNGFVTSAQTLSGTGAVRVLAEFLRKYIPDSPIYVSEPTWGNHNEIFQQVGMEVKNYRYVDKKTNSLDFNGLIKDLKNAPEGSIIVLHDATGVDPTKEQWKQIAQVCKDNNLYPLFDIAYQGLVSGDLE